jgi:Flp pilus assembly protein TadG
MAHRPLHAAVQRGRRTPLARSDRGQAAVELVALLPLVAILLAVAWQIVLAAHAAWSAGVAARAAARAHAVGADAAAAARAHLPRSLERGMRVSTRAYGGVVVSLRIPGAVRGLRLGRATATARFDPQSG